MKNAGLNTLRNEFKAQWVRPSWVVLDLYYQIVNIVTGLNMR